jgi:hypothetical protein
MTKLETELISACHSALSLFAEDHAISHFNWAASALRAEDIAELNEVPIKLRAVIHKASNEALKRRTKA